MEKFITKNKGFTLLEAMVAIFVAVILTSLAYPSFSIAIKSVKLRTTANQIKKQLIAAKVRALADPLVHCGVYITTTQTKIFFDTDASRTYSSGDLIYQVPYNFPNGITATIPPGFDPEIIFRGDGSARKSGKIILSDNTKADTISVLASTGRIRINKGNP